LVFFCPHFSWFDGHHFNTIFNNNTEIGKTSLIAHFVGDSRLKFVHHCSKSVLGKSGLQQITVNPHYSKSVSGSNTAVQ
jgi:hypothetical protein